MPGAEPRGDLPFHFRLTPIVVELLGLRDPEARALIARCGLPASAIDGPCTTSLRKVRDLVDEAQSKLGPDFGLALAKAVPEGTYDAAEMLVRTAPTLGSGLIALARFAALINPIGKFEVRVRGDRVELHYQIAGQRDCLGEPMNVFTIAYIVRALQLVGLPAGALVSVWFAHRGPKSAALEKHFGCSVDLGAATCGFAFGKAVAELPLRTSDTVTHGFLHKHANERLAALGERTVASMVADAIEREVGLGGIDLAHVAKRLGMTERTAQRRLADEGTSFREVLDQVRERVAEGMIATGVPMTRIADLLGFSDARSFRRAFARWTKEAKSSREGAEE